MSINVVVVAGLFCVSCSPSSGFILSPGSAPLIYLHYPNSQICGNKENNCENEKSFKMSEFFVIKSESECFMFHTTRKEILSCEKIKVQV